MLNRPLPSREDQKNEESPLKINNRQIASITNSESSECTFKTVGPLIIVISRLVGIFNSYLTILSPVLRQSFHPLFLQSVLWLYPLPFLNPREN